MDRPVEHEEGGDSVDVVAVVDQVMALRRQRAGGLSHHTHAQAPCGRTLQPLPLIRGRLVVRLRRTCPV